MASPPDHAGDQRQGYVAIDLGSTATRVVVVAIDPKTKKLRVLQVQDIKPHDDTTQGSRFERGEFPSLGCPFDQSSLLVGYDAATQTARQIVSLKSLVYFLTNDKDSHAFTEALQEHFSSLSTPQEKASFKEHLEKLLSQFFKNIVQKTLDLAQERGFDVRVITLCIPNTWSTPETNVQEYLGIILVKIVSGMNIEVTFTFEAAARAQYLLAEHPEHLQGYDYLMVLDFGGHSLGGSHGVIRWNHDGPPSLYSPPASDFGTRGGYEIWEIEVGKMIYKAMTKDPEARKKFPEEHLNTFLAAFRDSFFQEKQDWPSDRLNDDEPLYLRINLKKVFGKHKKHTFKLTIPAEAVNEAFDKAFRPILDLAKEKIKHVAGQAAVDKILILISGGSIANDKARQEIMEFNSWGRLRSHGTTKNKITVKRMEDIQSTGWKWTIAHGAAHSLATTMDVEEFFDRGTVLAIQNSTWKGRWTPHTSDSAKLLLYKEAGVMKRFAVEILPREDKKFRLIADPDFADAENDGGELRTVRPGESCYDVWELSFEYEPTPGARPLSRIPDGYYILEVSDMKYEGQDAVLTLKLRPDNSPAKRLARRANADNGAPLAEDTVLFFELPLVSYGENNIVVHDPDRIKGRFWKPRPGVKLEHEVQAAPLRRSKQRRPREEDTDSKEKEADDGEGEGGSHDSYDGRPAKRVSMGDID